MYFFYYVKFLKLRKKKSENPKKSLKILQNHRKLKKIANVFEIIVELESYEDLKIN